MKISKQKLQKIIQEELQEMANEDEVAEGLGGFLKGAAGAIGSKVAGAGSAVAKQVAGAGRAVGKQVAGAGRAVAKQVGDIAQAGSEMSMKQNITNAQKKINVLRGQLQQAEQELLNLQANAE